MEDFIRYPEGILFDGTSAFQSNGTSSRGEFFHQSWRDWKIVRSDVALDRTIQLSISCPTAHQLPEKDDLRWLELTIDYHSFTMCQMQILDSKSLLDIT
jgi:hypothetical protein